MGRKSREKRDRLHNGDIVRFKNASAYIGPGICRVVDASGSFVSFEVGEIYFSIYRPFIPTYVKCNEPIDWKVEEQRFLEYFHRWTTSYDERDPSPDGDEMIYAPIPMEIVL
jgi:hypothetical protein